MSKKFKQDIVIVIFMSGQMFKSNFETEKTVNSKFNKYSNI